jgi:hypothetical protein
LAGVANSGAPAFISGKGDSMQGLGNVKILFIAGFGPIIRDAAASRKLYRDVLGISFKEESDGYLHTEALKGAKSFALWPLSQAAQSCFGKDTWPDEVPIPHAWIEFDVENVERQRRSLNREDMGCSLRTRKNRGARLSAVSLMQKGCWWASPSLH